MQANDYFLKPTRKNMLWVSKPSLQAEFILGPEKAKELYNAKGTYCRKCAKAFEAKQVPVDVMEQFNQERQAA